MQPSSAVGSAPHPGGQGACVNYSEFCTGGSSSLVSLLTDPTVYFSTMDSQILPVHSGLESSITLLTVLLTLFQS